MNALAAKALEIVRLHTNSNSNNANVNNISATNVVNPAPKPRQNINYKELAQYIRVMDLKGVVDVFGEVKGDKHAAHNLAEFCISRWDMTPSIFEYVEQHLLAPLRYPIVYNKPDRDHVYAEDFENEWQFKRYCELIELKIKTKDGYIMRAPYIDAPLKISGANAFLYANRYKNAKLAAPMKMGTSHDVFDRISYYFHTHNLDIGRQFAAYKFDAKSIRYIENHFEICTEGEACSINRIVRIITNSNPDFVVPATLKLKFEMITGRVPLAYSDIKTITNDPNDASNHQLPQQTGKRRGKKQRRRMIADEA